MRQDRSHVEENNSQLGSEGPALTPSVSEHGSQSLLLNSRPEIVTTITLSSDRVGQHEGPQIDRPLPPLPNFQMARCRTQYQRCISLVSATTFLTTITIASLTDLGDAYNALICQVNGFALAFFTFFVAPQSKTRIQEVLVSCTPSLYLLLTLCSQNFPDPDKTTETTEREFQRLYLGGLHVMAGSCIALAIETIFSQTIREVNVSDASPLLEIPGDVPAEDRRFFTTLFPNTLLSRISQAIFKAFCGIGFITLSTTKADNDQIDKTIYERIGTIQCSIAAGQALYEGLRYLHDKIDSSQSDSECKKKTVRIARRVIDNFSLMFSGIIVIHSRTTDIISGLFLGCSRQAIEAYIKQKPINKIEYLQQVTPNLKNCFFPLKNTLFTSLLTSFFAWQWNVALTDARKAKNPDFVLKIERWGLSGLYGSFLFFNGLGIALTHIDKKYKNRWINTLKLNYFIIPMSAFPYFCIEETIKIGDTSLSQYNTIKRIAFVFFAYVCFAAPIGASEGFYANKKARPIPLIQAWNYYFALLAAAFEKTIKQKL